MADFIGIETDLQQIAKIKEKFDKLPPYVLEGGLDASADYLNSIRRDMYPESSEPFVWSSERQRRKVMALLRAQGGPPYSRTYNMADAGTFKVDKKFSSLYVYYENSTSYAKWVIGQFTQIIGHITRGWKPVNTYVVDHERNNVVEKFKEGARKAIQRLGLG